MNLPLNLVSDVISLFGTAVSIPRNDDRIASLLELERRAHLEGLRLVVLSRRPPQELHSLLSHDSTEVHWLSEMDVENAMPMELEIVLAKMLHLGQEGPTLVWLEGIESLAVRGGNERFLTFMRKLSDEITDLEILVVLYFDDDAFKDTVAAQLRREAPPYSVIGTRDGRIKTEAADGNESTGGFLPELVEPPLHVLTRLSVFSPQILKERILAWRSMGLDTTEVEPFLHAPADEMEAGVRRIESKIEMAVELDRRVDILEQLGEAKMSAIMRFRIRQLTGLDEITEQIDRILQSKTSDEMSSLQGRTDSSEPESNALASSLIGSDSDVSDRVTGA